MGFGRYMRKYKDLFPQNIWSVENWMKCEEIEIKKIKNEEV